MLNPEMVRLIETHTIGCVATVRPDGTPAVSPKATFVVIDVRTIAFANIRSPNTVDNLRERPDVEVDFIDVFARIGCRVRGRARYVLADDAEAALTAKFRNEWPDLFGLMKGIIIIDVTGAETVSSPSYDLGAATEQLTEHWLRRYASALGFAVTKQPEGCCNPGSSRIKIG